MQFGRNYWAQRQKCCRKHIFFDDFAGNRRKNARKIDSNSNISAVNRRTFINRAMATVIAVCHCCQLVPPEYPSTASRQFIHQMKTYSFYGAALTTQCISTHRHTTHTAPRLVWFRTNLRLGYKCPKSNKYGGNRPGTGATTKTAAIFANRRCA